MVAATSYGDITPVVDRTSEVRDAIVAAISDVDNALGVTEAHLATITALNLRNQGITELKSGDFSGLTVLTNLNLYDNQLSSLPDNIFKGLTALTTLRLGKNTVTPLPLTVLLEKVEDGQFRAVVPAGAPFDIVVPITVTNGSISADTTTFTVTKGDTESSPFNVNRTVGATGAVTTNIGTLPSLPRNHFGYTLTASNNLPIEVASALPTPPTTEVSPPMETEDTPSENVAPVFTDGSITIRSIAENTGSDINIGSPISATDTETLTYTLGGIDATSFSINSDTGQLFTKASLDYETKRVYTLVVTVSDGALTDTITVIINVIDIADTPTVSTMLPVSERTMQVQNAIVAAVSGVDSSDAITATHLSTITSLNLRGAGITELKSGDFGGLTALTSLNLYGNMLSRLPHSIFDGLTSLVSLRLGGNLFDPLPITVSLEQESLWTYRVVILTGAPFDVVVPITNTNIMVTIPQGSVKSTSLITLNDDLLSHPQGGIDTQPFFLDASVAIGALPSLPGNHFGYILARSDVCNRTQQVSDAITAALPTINDCRNVTEVQLAAITILDLSGMSIASLNSRDFAGMLNLTTLNLSNNQLSNLPSGIFASLSSLTTLNLSGNTVEPLPINVMLEKVDTNRIKVVVPSGAPFQMKLPINVEIGGILGFTNTITLMQGSIESDPLTIIRVPNTYDFVTADIGTMPNLPANHAGYVFINANDVPLQIFEQINVAPVFTDGATATRSIAENTEAGTEIGTPISATDVNNDTLTYTLSGPDSISFDIDSTTGQLSTKEALDYEFRTSYTVTITVSDGNLTDTIDVTINITDIDEVETDVVGEDDVEEDDTVVVQDDTLQNHAPEFTEGTTTTRSIPENTVSGTDIGNAVSATDADDDTLTYTLGGTDGSSFSIDSSSGQLRTEAALDFEKKDSYSVTIFVSDGNDGKDLISVTISVTDLDEAPDNTDPVFSDGDSTSRSIAENTGSGVDIGTPVSATDVDDGDTLSYSLGGTDAAAFSIDSTSGQLRTSSALDYETKNSYAVTVSVSDGNGGSDSILVTINITNIDETPTNSAPEFTEGVSTSRSIAENTGSGVDIGSAVSATDADGDTLTYTLGGTDASSFSLDSSSGQLRTSASLDYETKTSYSVILTVSDEKGASDSIRVTINVTDVDESPINNLPVFDSDNITTLSTPENTTSDTNIGSTITATDSDNNTLTYGLTGTDAASFDIVSTSGQLKTKAVLNHEAKDSYSVTVTVSDGQGGSDSIGVTINVLDVNESPSFSGESATRSIAENTTLNTNIGAAVVATDPDVNTTLTYTLDGTDAAVFSIDSKTGQLKTKDSLDFETKQTYSVTIVVSDGSLSDRITVAINIIDLDETPSNNPPVFTDGETTTRTVAENTATGADIGDPIAATDADRNTLAYAMSGDDASAFSIDLITGQLKTNAVLNYEVKKVYEVSVIVNDGSSTDSIGVTINVTDVNEAPVFEEDTVTHTIEENTAANTNIGTVITATDPDGDDLTYTLGGTDAASFNIGSTNGQLRTKDALDYETKRTYSVTVTASDGKLSDSITVTINVTDVDENRSPVFASASTTRSVAENTGSGVNIGAPVSASDADNDSLIYTLGGTDAASFEINSTNGQLRTKGALDYETKRTYSVTVTASDGKLSDSITVTINVTDVDENNAPVFASANTTRSVAENTGSGVNIGNAVSATDPDNDDLTYTLGGTDAASFEINSTNGQLRTKDALNYETKRTYSVTVTASDGKLSDSITVTINVTDVDENRSPVFASASTTRSVAENTGSGVNIGNTVSATDPDNDDLTYTLDGTDASAFNIVSSSGQLKTKAALNYENKDSYSVTISVSDGNGGSDSITVSINISDVNDPPKFTDGSSTSRSVEEEVETDTNIGTPIAATDEDGDTLTYYMTGDDSNSLSIHTGTGQLKTKDLLDYETKNSYAFSVWVTDGDNTDVIIVTVNVTNVDENRAPVFADDSVTLSVAENTPANTNIGNVITATDPDGDDLTYTLSGDDANSFSIVSTSGQLKTKSSLDYEDTNSYSVTVMASDGELDDSINVTINVTDDTTENNPPVFTDGETTTRSIAENTALGTSIGTPIVATDADNDTLTYTISGTNAASFSLVSTTGQLKTVAALDYEQKDSYSVTISVHDGNGGSDSIVVTINITNVHPEIAEQGGVNNAPVFTEGDSTTRSVPENTSSGENIGVPVSATDTDGDTLTYTLSGTDAASFSIVSTSGQLQTSAALDYDMKTSYTVTVTVLDGESGTDMITVTINVENVNLISTRTQAVIDEIVKRAIVESADDITTEHLQKITYMDLAVYRLTSLKTGDFAGLTGLEELLMDRNSLTSLPAGIFDDLTSLERLSLWANNISSFPDGLFDNLTKLEVLQVGSQSITLQLTSNMFDELTKLRTLSLSGSHLSSLPNDIFDELTSLTDLRLTHNNFTTFPDDTFEGLTALVKLELGYNDITTLTSDIFSDLTNLERIHLYDNDFTSIPGDIFESNTKLIFIEMFDNQLSSIPDNLFKGLSVLFGLDIRSKKVNPLPITASLEKVTDGQFKVKVPSGAPFEAEFQLSVSNGSINGDSTRATIDVGSVESSTFTVTRTSGTTGAVTVDISKLPRKPSEVAYLGFEFVKSADLPLTVIDASAAPATPVSDPIPDQTTLLSNFPNPFNPETWIPYHLAKPADVSLSIYDIRGVVVREIILAQQPAGYYATRPRAIHWDGRNDNGELVAGGVYFYKLTAGEYSSVRKMLILK